MSFAVNEWFELQASFMQVYTLTKKEQQTEGKKRKGESAMVHRKVLLFGAENDKIGAAFCC